MRAAARHYGIPNQTISRWASRGIIRIVSRTAREIYLDNADMAYCAEIYFTRRASQGRWLFNKDGTPYIRRH
jgi:hypothetical protein